MQRGYSCPRRHRVQTGRASPTAMYVIPSRALSRNIGKTRWGTRTFFAAILQQSLATRIVPMEQTCVPLQTGRAQAIPAARLSRVQLRIVVAGYVAVIVASAALVYMRHLQYVRYASDADTSGGMWAFGDWMLELFIAGLFLVPTLLLAFFIRRSETAYARYSQILFGIACTAPVCVGSFFVPAIAQSGSGLFGVLGWLSLGRISASPVFVVGLVCSRLLARSKRAKQLTMYALLVEVGTYVLLLTAVLLPWHRN